MNPEISIIIPIYNVAPYLRECLDSVIAQTFEDWEAICVDDGSTDGSGAILDEYAAKDRRFKAVHQKNAGVSVARNKALDLARGKWLSFLDADDFLMPEALEKLLISAQERGANVSIGNVMRFNSRGDEIESIGPRKSGCYSPEDLYVQFNSICAWSWGKIYKRNLWNGVRFPVGIAYSEDRFILHRLLYKSPEIPIVSEPIYRYRMRANSAYCSAWNPKWVQRRYALEEQLRFFEANDFRRAELFTAGLYFRWIGSDICHLASMESHDIALLAELRGEMRSQVEKYWHCFVKVARSGTIGDIASLGEIKNIIDSALSVNGRISKIRRALTILRYDGIGVVGRKIIQNCR